MALLTFIQIKNAINKWVDLSKWHNPHAVTLTMKQAVRFNHGSLEMKVQLDKYQAGQNFRHFINRLDKHNFGNAARRHGKHTPVFAVLEGREDEWKGHGGKRLHYHAVIDCPRDELSPAYDQFLADQWRQTNWGYIETDVSKADQGWVSYITKLKDKTVYDEYIDWTNCRIPLG